MTGFAMSSSGGSSFVETQCRLDAYTGAGFDNLRVRFHFGGAFYDWDSNWEIDDVGIYALGFDLKQTSSSTPYTLEVGEGATITTSFRNQGQGSLGTGGTVASADAYAYVNDMSGNELWSDSEDIGALAMAYYDESGNTHGGESTDMISFTFPGMPTAGLYTIGVKVADSTGATLADLFSANNDAHHMLIVGKSAVMADPRLTGGENWAAVDNEPSDVGDGAIGVTWDETGVATEALSVSIAGQGSGYSPSAPSVQIDTTVTWTNNDIIAHTVTDKDAQFDSFEIPAGSSWQMIFTEVGVFNYYCKIHPGMEGSVTVVSSASADEQARTDYMKVWTAKSYLVFWANFDMSDDSAVSVYAQKKGSSLEDIDTVGLWGANGFTIVDGSDHSDVGDSLTGSSGWNPYYIYLDSTKLGYNSLDYDPSDDNAYAFVFRARGVQGSADIGGVQLIRTLDTGFFFAKDDESTIIYEIFPSLAVKIDYFAKNVGTEDNIFRLSPGLQAQGEAYDGAAFETSIDVKMNGAAFDGITTSENADGSWTYAFDMEPDDEAMITLRFGAPDYDQALGEPAGNRKFDVRLSAYDVGSDENMREPITATLFIKPSQFVLGEITFNRLGVVEGASVDITVKAWNEGNYASDVLVVFYAMDSTGKAYDTLGGTGGVQRMTRVASTTVPLMAPKVVLQDQGIYQTWYFATATWDEVFIPGETVQDFETVSIYAEINPLLEQSDLDSGFEAKDEYLNQKDDNDASGEIAVVKDKVSTPSFAVGILGMSIAALVAAVGASLRREEE
jgi:plastocyanin